MGTAINTSLRLSPAVSARCAVSNLPATTHDHQHSRLIRRCDSEASETTHIKTMGSHHIMVSLHSPSDRRCSACRQHTLTSRIAVSKCREKSVPLPIAVVSDKPNQCRNQDTLGACSDRVYTQRLYALFVRRRAVNSTFHNCP